jgi:hypothetical protein
MCTHFEFKKLILLEWNLTKRMLSVMIGIFSLFLVDLQAANINIQFTYPSIINNNDIYDAINQANAEILSDEDIVVKILFGFFGGDNTSLIANTELIPHTTLKANIPCAINRSNILTFADPNHMIVTGDRSIDDYIKNGLITGVQYSICIKVVDAYTHNDLANKCIEFMAGFMSQLYITDCDQIANTGSLMFSIDPNMPIGSYYEIKCVPVMSYDQNIYEALSNPAHPIVYQTTSPVNIYQMTALDVSPMVPGQKYAISVRAINESNKKNPWSEPCTFTIDSSLFLSVNSMNNVANINWQFGIVLREQYKDFNTEYQNKLMILKYLLQQKRLLKEDNSMRKFWDDAINRIMDCIDEEDAAALCIDRTRFFWDELYNGIGHLIMSLEFKINEIARIQSEIDNNKSDIKYISALSEYKTMLENSQKEEESFLFYFTEDYQKLAWPFDENQWLDNYLQALKNIPLCTNKWEQIIVFFAASNMGEFGVNEKLDAYIKKSTNEIKKQCEFNSKCILEVIRLKTYYTTFVKPDSFGLNIEWTKGITQVKFICKEK